MPRPFTIDLRVRTHRTAREHRVSLHGLVGCYFHRENAAYVFLAPTRGLAERYFGKDPPECVLSQLVVDTIVHESLHSLIRSRGPNADARAHRAMVRLLHHMGMDWRY